MNIKVGDCLICIKKFGAFEVDEPARVTMFNVYINQWKVANLAETKLCYFNENLLLEIFKLDLPPAATKTITGPLGAYTITLPATSTFDPSQLSFDDSIDINTPYPFGVLESMSAVCECGITRTYPNDDTTYMHSDYCPKYVKASV